MSRPTTSLSVTRPLSAPRSLTGELVARLTDDITSGKIPPGLAPADRAGNDRGDRREPDGGARSRRRLARRRPGHHPPGRRRLRAGKRAPAAADRFRPVVAAARGARRHGAAHRHRDRSRRAWPPIAPRRRRSARSSTASMPSTPRSGAARTRSRRILRSIAASPMRPAIRNSGAFWSISDASSSRGRPFPAGPGYPSASTAKHSSRSTATSCRRSAAARFRRRVRRCAGISLNSRKRYQRLAAKLGSV